MKKNARAHNAKRREERGRSKERGEAREREATKMCCFNSILCGRNSWNCDAHLAAGQGPHKMKKKGSTRYHLLVLVQVEDRF